MHPFPIGDSLTVTLTSQQTVASLVVGGFEMAPNSSAHVSQRLGDASLRVRLATAAGAYTALQTAHTASITPIEPPPAGELAAARITLGGTGSVAESLILERHYAAAADKQHGGLRNSRIVMYERQLLLGMCVPCNNDGICLHIAKDNSNSQNARGNMMYIRVCSTL